MCSAAGHKVSRAEPFSQSFPMDRNDSGLVCKPDFNFQLCVTASFFVVALLSPPQRSSLFQTHATLALMQVVCGECTKRFATRGALALHRVSHHLASPGHDSPSGPEAHAPPPTTPSAQLCRGDRVSCPTCGDVSAREDLVGEHLAKLPLDHASQTE